MVQTRLQCASATKIQCWYRNIKTRQIVKKYIKYRKETNIDISDYCYYNNIDYYNLDHDLTINLTQKLKKAFDCLKTATDSDIEIIEIPIVQATESKPPIGLLSRFLKFITGQ